MDRPPQPCVYFALLISFPTINLTGETNALLTDLPKSAAITSANLLAFGILWLIQFPFAFIHPSKMAMVFKIKSVIAPIGLIVTMIWALVRYPLLSSVTFLVLTPASRFRLPAMELTLKD